MIQGFFFDGGVLVFDAENGIQQDGDKNITKEWDMKHFKACYAIALALCLVLTCGVQAYAEVASQNVKSEEPAEAVIEEMIEDEEYTESKVVFTDDDMLILPRPVKEGKIFVEWNTKEDGTGQGYNAEIKA